MEETYKDDCYCPFCDKETPCEFYSTGHERDSSQDTRTCTVCGASTSGLSGFRDWLKVSPDGKSSEWKQT